jgi:hypothetical protein
MPDLYGASGSQSAGLASPADQPDWTRPLAYPADGIQFQSGALCRPAHSNVDPLSRNPVATLPWKAAAGDLEDFPEYAAPEFGDGLNPPSHPTIRMVLLNRDVDSSEGIEDNPTSPGRQNLPEGQEPEEEGEGNTPNYLLMAPSKFPEEHTLRPKDTRFWKRIDPRKLFPDQEEKSEEEWVKA